MRLTLRARNGRYHAAAWCVAAVGAACIATPARSAAAPHAAGAVSAHLASVLANTAPHSTCAAWIQLAPAPRPATFDEARTQVSPRAWQRRLRRGSPLPDPGDLRVDAGTVDAIRARVTRVRAVSRWLRTVSVEATPAQITALEHVPGIQAIDLLATPARLHRAAAPRAAALPGSDPPVAAPPYGEAAAQLAQMHVPELHDRGLTGLGVLVAHFDTGYERFTHQVFRTLRVVAMRDYVDNDGDPTGAGGFLDDTGEHGSMTLSVLGGFRPGTLVGSAFGASFVLARTERTFTEDSFEEDYWIAALEWADSLGADVVSSSLKFREYDDGSGYTWEDMDGQTARVSLAARFAESRGILIVNGAGNDGNGPFHNTLVAPADADQVLAVGATNLGGGRASFSSVGPTTDGPGRIKPDVMAPGDNVWAMSVLHDSAYARTSGTSFSTPLVAGVVALLLSVHDATPAQLRTILRATASRASTPDNQWGWGIVNALAAYQALVAQFPADAPGATPAFAAPRFANPFRPRDVITAAVAGSGPCRLRVYDALGRAVHTWDAPAGAALRVRWDATDTQGRPLPHGVYFVELRSSTHRSPASKLTLVR